MRASICRPLTGLLFFTFGIWTEGNAQLNPQQDAAINLYISKTPELSKYDPSVKTKILRDKDVKAQIINCWPTLMKYSELERIKNLSDIGEMYSKFAQLLPGERDLVFPNFNRSAYRNVTALAVGLGFTVNDKNHTELLNHYYYARKDKYNDANSFDALIFQWPDLVESLRKSISAQIRKEADDRVLTLWLETNYLKESYRKVRQDALVQMERDQKDYKAILDKGCFSQFAKLFEDAAGNEITIEQNWNGNFANAQLKLKFERRGDYAFGRGDNELGSASESSQWTLSITGGKGEGEWIVTYIDNDKTINRIGKMTVKLDGEIMNFDMVETDWNIKWKEGVKPYETETAQIGMKMNGILNRKQ